MTIDTVSFSPKGGKRISLRLFVAGDARNSRMALENLRRFREKAVDREVCLEVVDVMKNPEIMLAHGIYLTPALQVLEPGSGGLIYGDLSDDKALQSLLTQGD